MSFICYNIEIYILAIFKLQNMPKIILLIYHEYNNYNGDIVSCYQSERVCFQITANTGGTVYLLLYSTFPYE